MSKNGYLISNGGQVTVIVDGNTFNVAKDHPNYDKIIKAIKDNKFDVIPALADVSKAIVNASNGKVDVQNGQVLFDGKVIHNSVTRRILDLMNGDYPFEPMVKFLQNLMLNPSYRAVNELYDFLEVNKLPITEDGCFLAYKRVREDYKDCYTSSIDNSVGKVVTMLRNLVNEDKDQTCSHGLHFCSLSYLSQFCAGTGHIMILKINPMDVVSIPSDYNNTKGRCCGYTVVSEHKIDEKQGIPEKFDKALYKNDGSEFEFEDDDVYDSEDGKCNDYDGDFDADDEDCQDCGYYLDCLDISKRETLKKIKAANKHKVNNPTSVLGQKPDGSLFWNVRDKSGKFTSKKK